MDKTLSNYLISGALVSGLSLMLYRKFLMSTPCNDKPDLMGKVIIVTGASSGIGEGTAKLLADLGAYVILACRDEGKTKRVIERIRKSTKKGVLEYRKLDLSNLDSVRDFAASFLESGLPLNVIINNAATATFEARKLSPQGYELHFATNHLGHFLLIELLIEKLKESKGRILNVFGSAYSKGVIPFGDINYEKNYSFMAAYSSSKLANALFTKELSKRMKGTGVEAFSVDPGFVATEGLYNTPWYVFPVKIASFLIGKSPEQGAQTSVYCAISDQVNGKSGQYFKECATQKVTSNGDNADDATRLWELSAKMVGLENPAKIRKAIGRRDTFQRLEETDSLGKTLQLPCLTDDPELDSLLEEKSKKRKPKKNTDD